MTITSADPISGTHRPLRSVLWRGDRTVATDLPADRIAAELAGDPEIKAWWFLPRDAVALAGTAALMGLDRLAIDDVLGVRETPKVDTVGSTVIVVTGALLFDPVNSELTISRVSILADQRSLVVIADERELSRLGPTLEDCAGRMRADGIGAALHIVLEAVVKTYNRAVEAIEEASDGLTASLFDDRPMGRDDQLTAFRLRQAIGHLRRLAAPMTEVTATLAAAAGRTGTSRSTIRSRPCSVPLFGGGSLMSPTMHGTPPRAPPACGKCSPLRSRRTCRCPTCT